MAEKETTYIWTGPDDTGLPYPTGGSPPDGANQIKKLAESIAIYGTGRPDTDPQYADAPTGAQYIFTGNQTQLDAVFGARVWRKTPDDWFCIEGQTEKYILKTSPVIPGLTFMGGPWVSGPLSIQRSADSVYFRGTLFMKAQSGNGSTLADYLWQIDENSEARRWLSGRGSVSQPFNNRDYKATFDVLPQLARVYGSYNMQDGNGWVISANIPVATYTNNSGLSPWPTDDSVGLELQSGYIARLKTEIEQAAKDNPELAEQLRQELEALEDERNG